MTPSFASDKVANCGVILNLLLPGLDFVFYYAPTRSDLVDCPDKLEAFDDRIEVFPLLVVSSLIEIVEVDFRSVQRVGRAKHDRPGTIFRVRFHYQPCEEIVLGGK